MQVDSALPNHADTARVQQVCLEAADRAISSLPHRRDRDAFAHWTDATLEFLHASLPFIVQGYVAHLGGDDSYLENGLAAIRAFGADRARTGVSAEQFLRVSVWTRNDLIRLLIAEIGNELDAETKLAVYEGISAYTDALLTEFQTGFAEELAALAAEQEGSSAQILRATQAGLALGDRDGNIVYANDAFSRYLGARDAEVLGSRWCDAVAIPDFETLVAEAVDENEVWRDITCDDEFGNQRVLRISLRNMGHRIHAVVVDITFQAEFERMRRDFIRGLIHDLRSPLTLISGWANTLLHSNERLDDNTRRKALETIIKASRQVSNLTENLLELDLIDGKAHNFEYRTFDAHGRLQLLLPHADASMVRVMPGQPVMVTTDEDAFDRIVTNLVDNALAHGETPVTITVTAHAENGMARVDFADIGTIDPAIAEAAFAGRVKSSKGFGIGLRATRLLIEALGGQIALTCADPTTFAVWMPEPHD